MEKMCNYMDIIISLREEYQKCREEFEMLKKLTKLNDKKIEDYYFKGMGHPNLGYTEILLDRDIKITKLAQILERLNERIDITMIDRCKKNATGDYEITEVSYKKPTILNQQMFNEQADKILASCFVKNVDNQIDFDNSTINFTCNGIYLYRKDYQNSCIYDAIKDCIRIQTAKKMTLDDILYLIHTDIPTAYLNEWQQNVVEEHYKRHEIVLPIIPKKCKELNVSIEQEQSQVRLRKI